MKKNKWMKRITAGVMTVFLTTTGVFGNAPFPVNAAETGTETGTETGKEDFNATLGGIKKYFMSLGSGAGGTPTSGESLAAPTTTVSFAAADGFYYLVRETPEPWSEPEKPDTSAQALDNGWVKKLGTDGIFVWQNLAWNRNYEVYELDLTANPTAIRKVGTTTTGTGIVGGTVTFTGAFLIGTKVSAAAENATTGTGVWTWYMGDSADGTTWTEVPEGAAGADLVIPSAAGGSYLKAVYSADSSGDFTGSIEAVSPSPAATALTGVAVTGTPAIGQSLSAAVTPAECMPGTAIEWYRVEEGAVEATGGKLVYTGTAYEIQAEDIGSRLYVKAVSRPDSVSYGEAVSSLTESIGAVSCGVPEPPRVTERGAISLTLQMPEGSVGLYEFGYSKEEDVSESSPDFIRSPTKVRGTSPAVLTGLESSTTYYIWVRQAGENGFKDSGWSRVVSAATLPPALTGGLVFTGNCSYGESLTASLTESGQNGTFHWYRDGAEIPAVNWTAVEGISASYRLTREDIGKKLTVIYEGKEDGAGNPRSGTLTAVSDTVEKMGQAAPVFTLNDSAVTKTDGSLSFTIPLEGGKELALGYAETAEAAPSVVAGTYTGGGPAEISGLSSNSEYYIFLRYKGTDTEKEGAWSTA